MRFFKNTNTRTIEATLTNINGEYHLIDNKNGEVLQSDPTPLSKYYIPGWKMWSLVKAGKDLNKLGWVYIKETSNSI